MHAKSLQSCPTLCDPMDCPWDFSGKNTGMGDHALLQGIFRLRDLITSLISPALAGRFFTTTTTWEAANSLPECDLAPAYLSSSPVPAVPHRPPVCSSHMLRDLPCLRTFVLALHSAGGIFLLIMQVSAPQRMPTLTA